MSRLLDNLHQVHDQIAAAARTSGRAADDITLVAVTKYAGDDAICELLEAGCCDLGEARPQSLWAKAAALAQRLDKGLLAAKPRWHLIGHLQRNKVAQTLPHTHLIHSADSLRLFEAIEPAAAKLSFRMPVLIEVNISGDATKHGFSPEEVVTALPKLAALDHVAVRGLMCMAAREGDTDVARRNFAALCALRDRLLPDRPENASLDELSMGMSADYTIAIEEGATMVRVGSALFEGVSQ